METLNAAPVSRTPSRLRMWLGVLLLVAGLSGHLFAARAMGGYYVAYRDHILGFFFLSTVSLAIIGPLGWRFWRGRPDITVLVLGVLQALLGLLIYITFVNTYTIH
jgi:hypothetical protein